MMKSKLLMFAATLVAGAGFTSMQAQNVLPYLPTKADFGGSTVTTPSDFLPSTEDYTLEVSGTAGTEISIAGGVYTYIPTVTGKVRFSQKDGQVFVYEGNKYKTTLTPVDQATFPDIFDEADNSEQQTGIYDARNLFSNPGFETRLSTINDTQYNPVDWANDGAGGVSRVNTGSGISSALTGYEGEGVFMSHSGASLSQEIAGMKSNTPYKLKIRTWGHDNTGQSGGHWYIGFGSAVKSYEIFRGTFTKPSGSGYPMTDYEYTFLTGDLSEYASVMFSVYAYERTGANLPITHYDRMTLVEGVAPTGITGATNPVYLTGAAYAPEVELDLEAGDYYDMTSYIINHSFETGSLAPWTTTGGNDTGVKPNSNGTYTTEGVDGMYLFNTWDNGAGGKLQQVITNLPNGIYTMVALIASDKENSFTAFINDTNSEPVNTIDEKGVFTEIKVENVNVLNNTITLGINSGRWYKADNFRLYYYGYKADAAIEALQELIEDATALKENKMGENVLAGLNVAIQNAENAISTATETALEEATATLNHAIANAETSIASYATLASAISYVKDLIASIEEAGEDASALESKLSSYEENYESALTDEVTEEANVLREEVVNEVLNAATTDVTDFITDPEITATGNNLPNGWNGIEKGNTWTTGGQFPGDSDKSYLDSWAASGLKFTVNQSLNTLNEGVYVLSAISRSSGPGAYIYASVEGTIYKTEILSSGDRGGALTGGWNTNRVILTVPAGANEITIGISNNPAYLGDDANEFTGSWYSACYFELKAFGDSYISVADGVVEVKGNVDTDELNEALTEEVTSVQFAEGATASGVLNPANSNTIFYGLPAGATLETGKGINAEDAGTVVLTGGAFNAPTGFDVTSVNYNREFNANGATSNDQTIGGWQSIVVPFDVIEIAASQNEQTIQLVPFSAWDEAAQEAEKRPFWLYEVNPDATDASDAYIAATSIKANTVYLISMPNDPSYGPAYNISGEVTFIGTSIAATNLTPQATEVGYILNANFEGDKTGIYALNAEGSAWVANQAIESFHGYASILNGSTPQSLPIFGGDDATSIKEILSGVSTDNSAILITTENGVILSSEKSGKAAVYSVSGQLIKVVTISEGENFIALPAGQYVINGSVAIVK